MELVIWILSIILLVVFILAGIVVFKNNDLTNKNKYLNSEIDRYRTKLEATEWKRNLHKEISERTDKHPTKEEEDDFYNVDRHITLLDNKNKAITWQFEPGSNIDRIYKEAKEKYNKVLSNLGDTGTGKTQTLYKEMMRKHTSRSNTIPEGKNGIIIEFKFTRKQGEDEKLPTIPKLHYLKGKDITGKPLNDETLKSGIKVMYKDRVYITGNRYHNIVDLCKNNRFITSANIKDITILD